MRWRQSDHERAKREEPYAGRDGPIFEQNEPPAIGKKANAANRTAIDIDFDLDAAAIGTDDGRDRISVRRAHRLRASAIQGEVGRFIVPDERLVIHPENGPVAGLLDDRMPGRIDNLVSPGIDDAKALVLQSQALIDGGRACSVAAVCRCCSISLARSSW